MKRSLQYDLEKKLQAVNLHAGNNFVPSPTTVLNVELPFKTLDEFLLFEDSINLTGVEDEDQRQTTKRKLTVW